MAVSNALETAAVAAQAEKEKAVAASKAAERGGSDAALLEEVMCPISLERMVDPVTAADGLTYERAAIEDWLSKKAVSPLTNEPLADLSLRPNVALRSLICRLFPDEAPPS